MASQERAGRLGRIAKLVSDLEPQSQTISGRMGDLVPQRQPAKKKPMALRTRPQSFLNLPEAAHARPCMGFRVPMMMTTYTYIHPTHPGKRAESMYT